MQPAAVSPRSGRGRVEGASAGFSLIELMVAVAIVGILAALAYPSYRAYMERSDRTDATSAMYTDAQILQRCYSQTYNYANCLTTTAPTGVTGVSPSSTSSNGYYDITVTAPSRDLYTITAKPAANSPQASDTQCQTFTLQSNGAQGSTPASAQTCWGSS